ncbi:MAG: hypothetical protein WCD56_16810, partial [Pseudolabrys sp.]
PQLFFGHHVLTATVGTLTKVKHSPSVKATIECAVQQAVSFRICISVSNGLQVSLHIRITGFGMV